MHQIVAEFARIRVVHDRTGPKSGDFGYMVRPKSGDFGYTVLTEFATRLRLRMIYPHRIRLNGPWNYEVLPLGSGGGTVRLPGDWRAVFGDAFRGSVRLHRRFNLPTGLEAHERVWLVVPGGDAAGHVLLNDRPLGQVLRHSVAAEFDITAHLLPHNQLTLEIEVSDVLPGSAAPARALAEPPERGPLGNIRLEIRRANHD